MAPRKPITQSLFITGCIMVDASQTASVPEGKNKERFKTDTTEDAIAASHNKPWTPPNSIKACRPAGLPLGVDHGAVVVGESMTFGETVRTLSESYNPLPAAHDVWAAIFGDSL